MNSFFPGVILTAKTLKDEQKLNVTIEDMFNGRYVHFNDWQNSILKYLEKIGYDFETLLVNINVDGTPLFKDSRRFHCYPILVKLCNYPKIVCVGFYLSENERSNKMPDVNDFLVKFVIDMRELLCEGMNIGGRIVKVSINAFVCDAPARSALKKIVNHNSYFACERCIQRGGYASGHVILNNVDSVKRTDTGFISKLNVEHHLSGPLSILCDIGVGLVSKFALDYMHLTLLGVTKRLLTYLKVPKKTNVKCNLNSTMLQEFHNNIISVSQHVPSEFCRNMSGGLNSLAYWKATEFRLFMLYGGIVALEGILESSQYKHFLKFSLAMRILLTDNQLENMDCAKALLESFVKNSVKYYGEGFLSYNIHSIVHLVDDYYKWGNLDSVSCFPFESYLGSCVKGRLSGFNKPLEQLCRHISLENKNTNLTKANSFLQKKNSIKFKDFILRSGKLGDKDNCVLLNSGDIAIITAFNKNSLNVDIYGTKSLFTAPLDSKLFGIFQIDSKITCVSKLISDIHSKCFLLPKGNFYIAIKVLHTNI